MNGLFVNAYGEQACGVYQFGKNLYEILHHSGDMFWSYCEPSTRGDLMELFVKAQADVVLYNYSSVMGGWLSEAPFTWIDRQALVFHDGEASDKFKAIFFADPTFTPEGKWHVIGRPLPRVSSARYVLGEKITIPGPVIGCHGFLGAWADEVVKRVIQEFEYATIRLQLPYSIYCDPNGEMARAMATKCREMVKDKTVNLTISHQFLSQQGLLDWLGQNDLNCYIRPLNPWRGVSSAPDSAIAVNKPIAVNICSAFRHLHNLQPSIVVDQSSLLEIIGHGLSPLVDFKNKWCDPDVIRKQIETVLLKL